MFQEERRQKIIEILNRQNAVSVKELSKIFGITDDTVRADLDSLEEQGVLKRVHGGAMPVRSVAPPVNVGNIQKAAAKRKIAQAALKLIRDGEMIFLDVSAGNLAVAELLLQSAVRYNITVATNMIDVLAMLAKEKNMKLIFVGGALNKHRNGFCGSLTLDFIERLKPDIAFVGAVGADINADSVSSYDIEDGLTKAGIIRISKKAYVLADSDKLGGSGNYNYAKLSSLSGLITDQTPSAEFMRQAKKIPSFEVIVP